MKMKGLLCALTLLMSATAYAQVDIDPGSGGKVQPPKNSYKPQILLAVWFDCYLDTGLNCVDVEKAFFEADHMARAAKSEKEADVVIRFRDWQIPPLEQYEATYTDNSGNVTQFKLSGEPLQVRATFTPTGKIEALIPHLLHGVLVHHQVRDFQYTKDGVLTVSFNAKKGSAPIEKKAPSPWYIQGGGGGMAIFQAPSVNVLGNVTVTAGFTEASATDPGWLVEVSSINKYNFVSTTVEVGHQSATESATNFSTSNGLIIAKSLSRHWAVATFIRENRDPSSNYASQTQVHAGIEYELIPYLTSNDNALTINYLIGGNYQTYMFPNMQGQLAQAIATHALSIYYVYHTHAFDVSGSVGVTSHVNDVSKWAVGAQLQTRLYLTRTLTLDLSTNFGYKNNLVNAPANSDAAYQVLSLMGVGSAVTPTTLVTRLMLTYTWGGTLNRNKDTRWQFTSDEVPNNF